MQCIGRGTRLDDGKPDTLVTDVVDVSSRFSLANVAKVMGLPENLDFKGRPAHKTAKRLEEVASSTQALTSRLFTTSRR